MTQGGEGLCRIGQEPAETLRLWDREGWWVRRELWGLDFFPLLWEAGSPAGACMDFETLPCRTEPKPWDSWPPPSLL